MSKIFIHLPDGSACSYYRVVLPTMQCYSDLAKEGIQLIFGDSPVEGEKCDVYMFHRIIKKNFWQAIYQLQCKGSKICWSLDDDIFNVTSQNPASNKIHDLDKKLAIELYDYWDSMVVNTKPLFDLINRPEKTFIAPNLVDLSCFTTTKKQLKKNTKFGFSSNPPIRILWTGSNTHDEDLQQIVEPVLELIKQFGQSIQFVFWGYLPTSFADFVRKPGSDHAILKPKKTLEKNIIYVPTVPFRAYYDLLANLDVDIGIAPLSDCKFNHSKSSLKSLEMIMSGAAFVGTNLTPYQWIENHQDGILIEPGDKNGWFEAIKELIHDRTKRKSLVQRGKEKIQAKYCWQSPAKNIWLEFFSKLLD